MSFVTFMFFWAALSILALGGILQRHPEPRARKLDPANPYQCDGCDGCEKGGLS